MSKLSLRQINFSQLANTPIIDGQLVCCLDSGDFYRDTATERIPLANDIITVTERPLALISGKFYYLSTTHILYDSNWNPLNELQQITRTNTTNSQNVNHGDSFSIIDQILTDNYGRVTGTNTKTINVGGSKIVINTNEYWSNNRNLKSENGVIYIFSDYYTTSNNTVVPGIKIGDGNAYVYDLPFVDEKLNEHILNSVIHVTQADKDRWNSKDRGYMDTNDTELLVFTTN